MALAVLVALGGVAATTRQAAIAWLTDVVPGDALLTAVRPVALDEPQLADLAAVPGVARLSPIGLFAVAVGGQRLDAAAVVGADLLSDGRLELAAGDRATALPALDAGGSVILPASISDRLGIPLGGLLQVLAGRQTIALRVVGIAVPHDPGDLGRVGARRLAGRDPAPGRAGRAVLRRPLRARPGGGRGSRPRAARARGRAGACAPAGGRGEHRGVGGPPLRAVDRPGPGRVDRRRAGDRQHALDERPGARPRARLPAGGRPDQAPGAPAGDAGGGRPRGRRRDHRGRRGRGRGRSSWPRWDPASASRTIRAGGRSALPSSAAWGWRSSPRPGRPTWPPGSRWFAPWRTSRRPSGGFRLQPSRGRCLRCARLPCRDCRAGKPAALC